MIYKVQEIKESKYYRRISGLPPARLRVRTMKFLCSENKNLVQTISIVPDH